MTTLTKFAFAGLLVGAFAVCATKDANAGGFSISVGSYGGYGVGPGFGYSSFYRGYRPVYGGYGYSRGAIGVPVHGVVPRHYAPRSYYRVPVAVPHRYPVRGGYYPRGRCR